MDGRRWIDVVKDHAIVVFVNFFRREFARGNLAEDTVVAH